MAVPQARDRPYIKLYHYRIMCILECN